MVIKTIKAYKNNLLTKIIASVIAIVATASVTFAQEDKSPAKGFQAGNSYAISDIESVNLQNGNLSLNIPLASLGPGRGTSPGVTVSAHYDSKIYNSRTEYMNDGSPTQSGNTRYTRQVLDMPDTGGWSVDYSAYVLEVINREGTEGEVPCAPGNEVPYARQGFAYKVQMHTPGGGVVTFRPYGSDGAIFNDFYGDNFFSIDTRGIRHIYGLGTLGGDTASCSYNEETIDTDGMDYYSVDGSAMRLHIPAGPSGVANWTLYLPTGTTVEYNPTDDTTVFQRMTDRNGNKVVWKGATVNGFTGTQILNDVGKSLFVSNNLDKVIASGYDGEQLITTLTWKTVYVYHRYKTTQAHNANAGSLYESPVWTPTVLDKITLPTQAGGLDYEFTYHADDTAPAQGVYTAGWGELKSIELPSNAKASYGYSTGIFQNLLPAQVLESGATGRTLTYWKEYDQSSEPATEVTKYNFNSVTTPDGARRFEGKAVFTDFQGYNARTFNPDGSISEKIWDNNIMSMVSGQKTNVYVKTEFTSIPDANGNPVMTAIKDFDYDKNGNVLEVREYDWVPYSSVPRIGTGIYLQPTGLPSSGLVLKRKTINTYYNPTNVATDTTFDGGQYAVPTSPKLHNVIASTERRDGSNNPVSRTEFFYDDPSNKGNLTEARIWDNGRTNGAYSNPLTTGSTGNSISTYATYDTYGNPLTTTDAKGVVTQITYGSVNGYSGLYPTQTVAANGSPIARTSTATYDYTTGLIKTATDVDNSLTNATEYDALGRPIKAITAQGIAQFESWTTTEYNDVARRVIVRSDLETKGDAKKVGVQFYDQFGRVRLTKTLEDAASQSATNETDGIKVQTRYKYDDPENPDSSNGTFVLTSNPYRATTSGGASGEPTMGWTLSYANKTGKNSSATTYSGATLPLPFVTSSGNANPSGTVTTDIDLDRTLVIDQAGKKRISKTNVLGQLSDVWEVTTSDSSTVAVTFSGTNGSGISAGYQTSYKYDVLGNLTKVEQGTVQTPRNFYYTSLSRLSSAINPESGTVAYVYDKNGNLTQKSVTGGVQTTYTYDALNRVKTRSYTGSTSAVAYTYDDKTYAVGQLTKVVTGSTSSPLSVTEYEAFDRLGRVTQSKQTTDGTAYNSMTYAYNLSGALIEQKYPSGRVVKNVLDSNGDLATVQSKKNQNAGYWNYAENFTSNAAGAVTSMQLGNGHWESTQFNSRLQPTQIALGTTPSTTNLLKLDYSYGEWNGSTVDATKNNGNVGKQVITVPSVGSTPGFSAMQTYYYDSLNRLGQATEYIGASGQSWQQTFAYDRFGNRNFVEAGTTTLTRSCGSSLNFTICAADKKRENPDILPTNNRIKSDQDGDYVDDYTFDSAGNTTKMADGKTFVYDGENKQTEVWNGSLPVGKYFYDGDGKRVKKMAYDPSGVLEETTIFVYDASGKPVAEYSTLANPTPQVSYMTNDSLGSPRINTNENGAVISRHDYHPFGEEIATLSRQSVAATYAALSYVDDDNRKQYTGYERDGETGLDFAQARYFNSGFGRFSSPDSFLNDSSVTDPQSWNLYAYVRNNPFSGTDPTGRELWVKVNDVRYQYVQCDGGYKLVTESGEDYTGNDEAVLATQSFLNNLTSGQWVGEVESMMISGNHEFRVTLDPSQNPDGGPDPPQGTDEQKIEGGKVVNLQRIQNVGGGVTITGNNEESEKVFSAMFIQAHSRTGQTMDQQTGFDIQGNSLYNETGLTKRQERDNQLKDQVNGEAPRDNFSGLGARDDQQNINCPFKPPPPPPLSGAPRVRWTRPVLPRRPGIAPICTRRSPNQGRLIL